MNKTRLTRRAFLLGSAAFASGCARLRTDRRTAPAPIIRPRRADGILNVAAVGVGGKGWSNLRQVAAGKDVRIVALCDVDSRNMGRAAKAYPSAKTFVDYRLTLDAMHHDIDAVVVSTPDHMHGPVALAAMSLGKDVFVEKPLAHNLAELRAMAAIAEERGLVTQMGTQIHSHASYRTAVAMLRRGTIGRAREAQSWVSHTWGKREGRPDRSDPIPDYLDWDCWLGVAPERPYVNKIYHPNQWRRWKDFGAGTLGDMGCHIFDPVFSGLGLGPPIGVVSHAAEHFEETFSVESDIVYAFNSTEHTTSDFTLRWMDGVFGATADPARAQLPPGASLPGAGSFVVGEKGVMVLPHWSMPTFYSNGEVMEVEIDRQESRNHYTEWTDACRGEGQTSTPFSYAATVAEAVLVGTVAARFRHKMLAWDSARLRFNSKAANRFVGRDYRKGWKIKAISRALV